VRYEHKYPLGLGRKKAPDDRDKRFAISAVEPKQDRRMWPMRYAWLDQNGWPHCVGYSWTHWAADAPVLQPNIVADANYADQLYFECQKVDEWPGENYDGTSVRAGTKVLQARGLIQSYRWAWDANTVVSTVINEGPVVMGSDWYAGMSKPRHPERSGDPSPLRWKLGLRQVLCEDEELLGSSLGLQRPCPNELQGP
jgi:hypothetical protein